MTVGRRRVLQAAAAVAFAGCDPGTRRTLDKDLVRLDDLPPLARLALALGPWEVAAWPSIAPFARRFAEAVQIDTDAVQLATLARRAVDERRARGAVSLGEGEARRLLEDVAVALYATPVAHGALLGEPPPGCVERE